MIRGLGTKPYEKKDDGLGNVQNGEEEVERRQDGSLEVLERWSLGGGQGAVPVGSRGEDPQE